MFFCEKCRYLFNITKDIKSKQLGGKVINALDNIFDKFSKNEKIVESDLERLSRKELMDDERFESLNRKDQKKLMSQIRAIDKDFFAEEEENNPTIGSNIAYFICKFCKNHKLIKPGTLIYSKNFGSAVSSEMENYAYAIHDSTLPRTKNYICKNVDCRTHQDPSLQEAVLTKSTADQLIYVCTQCSTYWVHSS